MIILPYIYICGLRKRNYFEQLLLYKVGHRYRQICEDHADLRESIKPFKTTISGAYIHIRTL